ncbi:MAG: GntR family transcriptional regulator [Rhodobacteraceae bacterium]|jgi:DNA-binding GntR family transcriptional regulator|nr:GntR family transcriptional regulator [Paracoccaceae bacterium]
MTARIVELMKREIVNGTIGPDEVVIESALAARFGVSKTPVREALLRLHQMGLVSVIPGKGYTVTKLSWKEVKDLYEVRLAMEGIAAELAAQRADPATVTQLMRIAERPLYTDASVDTLLQCNFEFHQAVWQASRNDRLALILTQVIHDLMRAMHTAMHFENAPELVAQHRALAELIGRQDPAGARQFVQDHIRSTQRRLFE